MKDGSPVYTIIGLLILLLWLTVCVVTALKGKWGFFVAGFLIQLFWFIGAIRLAKPGSWWARRFYEGDKLARAQARFWP